VTDTCLYFFPCNTVVNTMLSM